MSNGSDLPIPHAALLILDPDPRVTTAASEVFAAANWEIECAPDNEAGLAIVQRRPFDVVLTSQKTRVAADVDLLLRIRRIHRHTRMIILTDQSTPSDAILAMHAHAFSLFSAPLCLDQLREMLKAVIDAPCWDDGIELVSATPYWLHLYARCDLTTADRLVQFIKEVGDDLPEEEKCHVSLAIRELLVNAIEHGGHFDPSEYVEISYLRTRRAVACRIKDPGEGFSLEDIQHAAVSNPPDNPFMHLERRAEQNRRPGGFGILMARRLVDEVIYGETGNEVVLIKYLPQTNHVPVS